MEVARKEKEINEEILYAKWCHKVEPQHTVIHMERDKNSLFRALAHIVYGD